MKPRKGKKPGENASLEWQVVGNNYFRNVNTDTGTVYDAVLDSVNCRVMLKVNNEDYKEMPADCWDNIDHEVRAHSAKVRGWTQ